MNYWEATSVLNDWELLGVLLSRLSVGLSFFISGFGKIFFSSQRIQMKETVEKAELPVPKIFAIAISFVEFLFGIFLVLGYMTQLCCLLLCCVMVGALTTTILPNLKTDSKLSWLSQFLYLPEVLYIVILIWLFFHGPAWVSIDYILRG